MKSTDFYKQLYFREIDRKHQLNNDINIPILLLSATISIQTFLYSNEISGNTLKFFLVFSAITAFFGLYTLLYIFKSFSNSFKSHTYKEIADAKNYYDYELELRKKLNDRDTKINFSQHLTKELSDCAGHNFQINKNRTEDLSKAKKGIFFCVVFTLFLCVTFSISILINMAEQEKPTSDSTTHQPTAETKPQGPQSVYIQNSAPKPATITKKTIK